MAANFCQVCGTPLEQGGNQCPNCGRIFGGAQTDPQPFSPPIMPVQRENRPLGTWEFFWIRFLCGLPLIGVIFILIWSFDGSCINRRNLARSMVISWVIGVVLTIIFSVVLVGAADWMLKELSSVYGMPPSFTYGLS